MSIKVIEVGSPEKLKVGKTRDRDRDKKSIKRPTITVTEALMIKDRAAEEDAAFERELVATGDPEAIDTHVSKLNRKAELEDIRRNGHILVHDSEDMVIHIPRNPTPGPYFRVTFLEDGETFAFKWRKENGAEISHLIFSPTRSPDNKIEPTKNQKDRAKAYYEVNREHCQQKWDEALSRGPQASHTSKIAEKRSDRANGSYRA